MTSFITQCPNCSTRFRVGRSQLRAAHGAVRCGACLEVFNAAHHLLRDELNPTQPLSAPEAAPARPQTTGVATANTAATTKADETLWIHDDLDLDSLDLDEELAKLEQQERELARDLLSLEPDRQTSSESVARKADTASAHDESWAEILLNAERGVGPATHSAREETIHFTPVTAESPQPPSPLAISSVPLSTAKAQQIRSERIEPALASSTASENENENDAASSTAP